MLINAVRGEIAQRTEKDAGGGEIEVTGSLKSRGTSPRGIQEFRLKPAGRNVPPSSAFPQGPAGRGGDSGGRGGWEDHPGEGRGGIQPWVRPTGTKSLRSTQGEMSAGSERERKEK